MSCERICGAKMEFNLKELVSGSVIGGSFFYMWYRLRNLEKSDTKKQDKIDEHSKEFIDLKVVNATLTANFQNISDSMHRIEENVKDFTSKFLDIQKG